MPAKPDRTSITQALRSIRKGAAERYASELLAQVCRAVLAVKGSGTKKTKGTLTIVFSIEPDPKTDSYLLDVTFKTTAPTESYARTYFITDAGDLTDDPPDADGLFAHPHNIDDESAANVRQIRKDPTA